MSDSDLSSQWMPINYQLLVMLCIPIEGNDIVFFHAISNIIHHQNEYKEINNTK